MLNCDLANGYYWLVLVIGDIPKLAVAFSSRDMQDPLIALPLVLLTGWKNSGPDFCAATETAADLANLDIACNVQHTPYHLDVLAQKWITSLSHQPPHLLHQPHH